MAKVYDFKTRKLIHEDIPMTREGEPRPSSNPKLDALKQEIKTVEAKLKEDHDYLDFLKAELAKLFPVIPGGK